MTKMRSTIPKIVIAAASLLLLLCSPCAGIASAAASGAHAAAKSSAIEAANAWLKLVDSGDYQGSWNEASSFFRRKVSREQWTQQVEPLRQALGAMLSRKVRSATYMTSVPGAPDGEYVVIQYQTSFEPKRTAIETVTPMLDSDGKWHVSGYYIYIR